MRKNDRSNSVRVYYKNNDLSECPVQTNSWCRPCSVAVELFFFYIAAEELTVFARLYRGVWCCLLPASSILGDPDSVLRPRCRSRTRRGGPVSNGTITSRNRFIFYEHVDRILYVRICTQTIHIKVFFFLYILVVDLNVSAHRVLLQVIIFLIVSLINVW